MSCKKRLVLLASAILLSTILTSNAAAQNSLGRQRPLRWLGQGYSDGYHRCNPGHDSSYYNPYSFHNSMLYSQTADFQRLQTQNYAFESMHDRRFFSGVPFSVYAAPPSNQRSYPALRGNWIEHSVEPVDQDQAEDADAGNLNSPKDDVEEKSALPPAPSPFDRSTEQLDGSQDTIEPATDNAAEDSDNAFQLPVLSGSQSRARNVNTRRK